MSAHLKNKNIAPNFKLEKSEALKDNLLKALKVNFWQISVNMSCQKIDTFWSAFFIRKKCIHPSPKARKEIPKSAFLFLCEIHEFKVKEKSI